MHDVIRYLSFVKGLMVQTPYKNDNSCRKVKVAIDIIAYGFKMYRIESTVQP